MMFQKNKKKESVLTMINGDIVCQSKPKESRYFFTMASKSRPLANKNIFDPSMMETTIAPSPANIEGFMTPSTITTPSRKYEVAKQSDANIAKVFGLKNTFPLKETTQDKTKDEVIDEYQNANLKRETDLKCKRDNRAKINFNKLVAKIIAQKRASLSNEVDVKNKLQNESKSSSKKKRDFKKRHSTRNDSDEQRQSGVEEQSEVEKENEVEKESVARLNSVPKALKRTKSKQRPSSTESSLVLSALVGSTTRLASEARDKFESSFKKTSNIYPADLTENTASGVSDFEDENFNDNNNNSHNKNYKNDRQGNEERPTDDDKNIGDDNTKQKAYSKSKKGQNTNNDNIKRKNGQEINKTKNKDKKHNKKENRSSGEIKECQNLRKNQVKCNLKDTKRAQEANLVEKEDLDERTPRTSSIFQNSMYQQEFMDPLNWMESEAINQTTTETRVGSLYFRYFPDSLPSFVKPTPGLRHNVEKEVSPREMYKKRNPDDEDNEECKFRHSFLNLEKSRSMYSKDGTHIDFHVLEPRLGQTLNIEGNLFTLKYTENQNTLEDPKQANKFNGINLFQTEEDEKPFARRQKKTGGGLMPFFYLSSSKGCMKRCEVCQLKAKFVCSRCRIKNYCSVKHKQVDRMHSVLCVYLERLYLPRPFVSDLLTREAQDLRLRILKDEMIEHVFMMAVKSMYLYKHTLSSIVLKYAIDLTADVYGHNSVPRLTAMALCVEVFVAKDKTFEAEKLFRQTEDVFEMIKEDILINQEKTRLLEKRQMEANKVPKTKEPHIKPVEVKRRYNRRLPEKKENHFKPRKTYVNKKTNDTYLSVSSAATPKVFSISKKYTEDAQRQLKKILATSANSKRIRKQSQKKHASEGNAILIKDLPPVSKNSMSEKSLENLSQISLSNSNNSCLVHTQSNSEKELTSVEPTVSSISYAESKTSKTEKQEQLLDNDSEKSEILFSDKFSHTRAVLHHANALLRFSLKEYDAAKAAASECVYFTSLSFGINDIRTADAMHVLAKMFKYTNNKEIAFSLEKQVLGILIANLLDYTEEVFEEEVKTAENRLATEYSDFIVHTSMPLVLQGKAKVILQEIYQLTFNTDRIRDFVFSCFGLAMMYYLCVRFDLVSVLLDVIIFYKNIDFSPRMTKIVKKMRKKCIRVHHKLSEIAIKKLYKF